MEKPKLIDLFCGAGGFSLGAQFAGFHTALAVDKDTTLTSSYSRNFPDTKLLLADIAAVSGTTLLREAGLCTGDQVGIIGGPPCQGFSSMGKRVLTDPRNSLLKHYFRLVTEIKPKFFIMENVPGILAGGAKTLLHDAIASLQNYEITGPFKVNASDFGAATNRERVIVIGVRGSDPIDAAKIFQRKIPSRSTVADAIADLPPPRKSGIGMYRKRVDLSKYAIEARSDAPALQSARSCAKGSEGRVTGLLPTTHTAEVLKRFSVVVPGTSDSVSKCPRLRWDAQAPTLRAGTGAEHGGFQAIRPIHPDQDRVITVREAARLQGFPDWFDFHPTKWHSFRMIGNSVSPKLSKAILSTVLDEIYT